MNGILLSTGAFNTLSPSAQREVLASIGLSAVGADGQVAAMGGAPVATPGLASKDGEGPVELTLAMARKLTDKLSDKTLTTLKIIASSASHQFHMKDVIAGTQGAQNYMDMRGVWSALTRRTRKIMNDDGVDLIWWIGDTIDDAQGNYVDHIGTISPMTYQSLRTHFGF